MEFEDLQWNDAVLNGCSGAIERNSGPREFVCEVSFCGNGSRRSRLVFKNCLRIRVDLDLVGIEITGCVIADAVSVQNSALLREFLAGYEPQWLTESFVAGETIKHYLIEFIQPGGAIDILATAFSIQNLD